MIQQQQQSMGFDLCRVKFTERDGSVNGTLWPKIRILKGVDYFFHFFSFTIRKRSFCRCISMEVCPLNERFKAQIFHFNCIFTTFSISLFHEIRNGAYEISFQIYCDLKKKNQSLLLISCILK